MAQSFGEGFATGMQIGNMFRQRQFEQSIDNAGAEVQAEMQREKDLKVEQARAQEQLLANLKPTRDQVTPSTFQQGDSLGLQGYQVDNKPIQATVPTAPSGYGMREDGTTTDQTLMGNYGTAASFKGEKPTTEDSLRMQQEPTQSYDTTTVDPKTLVTTINNVPGPFTGENKQTTNLADLAANKPEATQEEAKPKALDTLNEQVIVADNAKEAYDYNMRVVRKLQQSGNARAALEYQGKVASTELTLAQADHSKFSTLQGVVKLGGDLANNAIEAMQAPGADANKIYLDWANNLKETVGYPGKIPFSLDPKENMKTIQNFAKGAATTLEKSEIAIKTSVAAQKSIFDNLELNIKQEKLTLEKIGTELAIRKDNREQITSSFNRTVELTKLQYQAINGINSTINEKDKEALKPVYQGNLELLKKSAKALNVPMPNIEGTSGTAPTTVRAQPGVAPTPAAVNAPADTQQVNPGFSNKSAVILGEKPISDTAGGFVPPTPKTPAQVAQESKTSAARKENIKAQIKELKASTDRVDVRIGKPLAKGVKRVGKASLKLLGETGKSITEWAAGKDETEINAKIAELQEQLDSIK